MFVELLTDYGILAAAIVAVVTLLWLLSLITRDNGVVDVFWGIGFVIIAWGAYILAAPEAVSARGIFAAALVSVWGVRLAAHIFIRNWGKPEDFRYQGFRDRAGAKWWWFSYFKVYLLQGAIMLVVAAPIVIAQYFPGPLNAWHYIGAAVWAVGFAFEAGGDLQLMLFKRNPANRGKVLDRGLWAWTRHPNYFGDAVQWWGFYIVGAASWAWGFAAVFSPLLMTFLLVRVSGVRMLDADLRTRSVEHRRYQERTSAFVPLPPLRLERPRGRRGQR